MQDIFVEIENIEKKSETIYHNLMNESRFEESNLILAIWRMSLLLGSKNEFVSSDKKRFDYYYEILTKLATNMNTMYENEKFNPVVQYKNPEIQQQVEEIIGENQKLLSEEDYIVQALQETLEAILDDECGDEEDDEDENDNGDENMGEDPWA